MKIENTTTVSDSEKLKTSVKQDDQDSNFDELLSAGAFELNAEMNFYGTGTPYIFGTDGNDELRYSLSENLKPSFRYDVLTMDKDDAEFFADAINKNEIAINQNAGCAEIFKVSPDSSETVAKSSQISKTLVNMLADAMNTSKPVRIDFGNNIGVILRVDRNGKVSADFIPSDKVAEQYLKNNLAYLKDSFDRQEIPYNKLTYVKYGQNRNKKQKGGQQ